MVRLGRYVAQAEVARRLQTSRQSVSRWARLRSSALAKVRRQGRKPGLTEPARAKLRTALLAGLSRQGCYQGRRQRLRQTRADQAVLAAVQRERREQPRLGKISFQPLSTCIHAPCPLPWTTGSTAGPS